MGTEIRTYAEAFRDITGHRSGTADGVDPDRRWAAGRVALLSRLLQERGWKQHRWTSGIPGPIPRKRIYGVWEWNFHALGSWGWFDHPYRLVNKAEGRTLFRVEPYGITEEVFPILAQIANNGWRVTVDAELALHFPGRTIVIQFEREKANGQGKEKQDRRVRDLPFLR